MIPRRLSIKGHPVGSGYDAERAVEFARAQGVTCYVEKFSLEQVNEAYDR
jgi:D-arabinose 1-dehydrogenase-like Zn-dependent alcohol dehydrogenase